MNCIALAIIAGIMQALAAALQPGGAKMEEDSQNCHKPKAKCSRKARYSNRVKSDAPHDVSKTELT